MAKQFSLYTRISNKVTWYYRYMLRSKDIMIYHCCIQKSGSQWFRKVFEDDLIWINHKHLLYRPADNFITDNNDVLKKLSKLPNHTIISPLYIRYDSFNALVKPNNYKAFFIARDPRDLIVSNYFSLKYSHSPYVQYIIDMREKLNNMSQNDGLSEMIKSLTGGMKRTLEGWFLQNSQNVKLIRFEDIFGENQIEVFSELIDFCGIKLSKDEINILLNKYSFKNISGRNLGTEDVKNHYRKGIPGDWKNYFTAEHKKLFKILADDLLITCGYEKDNNW